MTHFYLLWLQRRPSKYKPRAIPALMPAEKRASAAVAVGRSKIPVTRSGALAITSFSSHQLCHHRLIGISGTHRLIASSREVCLLKE